MNEILDLQRDLHAIDFALCEDWERTSATAFANVVKYRVAR